MKTLVTLVSFLFCSTTLLTAQYASMWMNSPRGNTQSFQSTIEDATAYVSIQSGHANVDIYLTFSTRAYDHTSSDSLELRCWFSLPALSFITDLWLWIGDDTSRAIIADRFQAQATYNNIVGARKDPALLVKEYGNTYSLNVFPFTLPGKRKVKISYTNPIAISDSIGKIPLPFWFLNASAFYNEKPFVVLIQPTELWRNPLINGSSRFPMQQVVDPTFGSVLRCEIPRDTLSALQTCDINVERSRSDLSWYAEKYQKGSGGIYRFILEPFKNLNIQVGRKMLFLLDHDSTNVNPLFTKTNLIEEIKIGLLTGGIKGDSFNVLFSSKGKPQKLSSDWISVDTQSVKTAFDGLDITTVLDTVDLAGVLVAGLQEAKDTTGVHGIFLIASSDQYDDIGKANRLVDSLSKYIPPKIKIFSIDYNDSARYVYWPGFYYTIGNSYLYRRLADKTGGAYTMSYNYNSESPIDYYIGNYIRDLRWRIEYFDMNVHMENGFVYQNFSSVNTNANVFVSTMVTQVGKFIGDFPLYVDMTGFYDGILHTKRIVIQDSTVVASDSSLIKVWASQMLNQFNSSYYLRNEQAVGLSIENRILSYWTAFLALEPGQKLCDTCAVGGNPFIITGVHENSLLPKSYEVLRAYPNPFNPTTTILISLPDGVEKRAASAAIYNVLGQRIKRLDISNANVNGEVRLSWNAMSDSGIRVSSGLYFVILTTPQKRFALKLLLMK
ncbi:MAG: T9SS type A sorting domain-containing protein [Ignavibacteriales bacterium]|nr:T9SS type A sorting domain-containing protein [Ignavibacteriales bacterium]